MVLATASSAQQAGTDSASSPAAPDSPLVAQLAVPPPNAISTASCVPLAHLRRGLPEEILKLICSTLNDMQPKVVPPSTGDPLLRNTLLSIQLTSKAGWKAATPYIWQTLRFAKDEDYVSFFAPVSLFHRSVYASNPGSDDRYKYYEDLLHSLCDDNGERSLPAHLESGLDRFFFALEWIDSIVIESAPPVSVQYEMENIRETKEAMWGGGDSLADGVDFFFGGKFCPPQDTVEGDLKSRLDSLHTFVTAFEPGGINVFDIPTADIDEAKWFWTVHDRLMSACEWLYEPLTILDLQPGCPLTAAYDLTTICLSPKASWLDHGPHHDFDQEIAKGIAWFIFKRMTDYGDTSFESFLHVKGWIGCPCGCDAHDYTTASTETLIDMIRRLVKGHLEVSGLHNDYGLDGADSTFNIINRAVREAFETQQIKICWTPCNDYEQLL
jgi:hypothetical protein